MNKVIWFKLNNKIIKKYKGFLEIFMYWNHNKTTFIKTFILSIYIFIFLTIYINENIFSQEYKIKNVIKNIKIIYIIIFSKMLFHYLKLYKINNKKKNMYVITNWWNFIKKSFCIIIDLPCKIKLSLKCLHNVYYFKL